ncbi:MAG: Rho termination factor N-terminal domain-containing protein [Bdellovibrionales bacterium]|nr:Rho termination factor N-terminal domain-containing protein [Bdellovibrionales bacterium]
MCNGNIGQLNEDHFSQQDDYQSGEAKLDSVNRESIDDLRNTSSELTKKEQLRSALQRLNRNELYNRARYLNVSNRSRLSKEELIDAILTVS